MANGDLINRKHCKDYILKRAPEMRAGWRCRRVSAKALDNLNTKVRLLLDGAIKSHRSVGVTFQDIQ